MSGVFLEELQLTLPAGAFRTAHPRLAGDPYILFLGRLHHKKGLDFLAEAYRLLVAHRPDVRLVVAGPDSGARANFEHRIAALGLQDRVFIPGPLYGQQKIAALCEAACFCLPSRQEGFSVAIAEALACKLPLVISEQCPFGEVGAARAGEVVELRPDAIANAMLRILADEARRLAMGESGYRLILERYTWPKIAESTIPLYMQAIRR